jgi:D-alanyl-D-alanine carboxypeptidase
MSEGYTQVRAKAEASKRIPQGNYSDYQTGLSVDIAKQNAPADEDFSATTEFRYLSSVCVNYGFVLRYPRFKEDKTKMDFIPNQFRYVGKDNALKMRTFEMCMDEYIYYLKAQKS